MKVLFFTNIPSPYRVDFFNELGKYCELTVLYERRDADDRDKNWCNNEENNLNFKPIYLKGKKIGADTASCVESLKYWRDKSFDIRIIGDYATPTGILSAVYMRIFRISYGIECDGGYIKQNERKFLKWIKKFLISKCQFVFSPGITTNEYLKHYGVDAKKIWFYPFSSLKLEDIKSANSMAKEKIKYRKKLKILEKKVILSVGQMIYRKGFDVLIESGKYLKKDIGIYIVGGNPKEEYLKLVEKNNLINIQFLNFMNKEELAEYYAAADIFVLPTREDIWGLVIEEAMSFGLPIITTDKCVAGVELLREGGGIIIPTDSEKQLTEAINMLLDNEEYCRKCEKHNLEIIKNYTIEQMARKHIELLRKIEG